ncbi:MAG: AMP-binding protein, partial [Lachnospiraceae bacterium]|nr:AMP-binding protein [Lachnospiraceae bacterium]
FDPETGEELQYGEHGEVCISGPTTMIGYYKNEEATNAMIREHADGRRWIHTGDIGYMTEDGMLYIDGRIKRMIIRNDGFKVFPPIIEDVIKSSNKKNKILNEIIYNTVNIIEKYGDTVSVDFPIVTDEDGNYKYTFTSDSTRLRFLEDMYGKPLDNKKHTYSQASAAETFKFLCETKFEVSDEYDEEMKYKIIAIRYNLFLNSYQKYVTLTIAKNVSNETMAAIYENEADVKGVKITEQAERIYNYSEYFAPIMGYTGTISNEQLEEYVEDGKDYIATDIVGKAGLEASLEDVLKGTRGEEVIFADSTGNKLSTISKKESKAGNNVSLTIDLNLQLSTYDLLEKEIASTLVGQIVNYDVNPDADNEDDSHPIGIKEIYFQLLNNNVVSINRLKKKKTPNEEKIYTKYSASLDTVTNKIKNRLLNDNVKYNDLSDEYQDYDMYIYNQLKDEGILLSSSIDRDGEEYNKWADGKISINDFLKHAIANQWIDISLLNIKSDYTTTDETYEALVDYIYNMLNNNVSFAKRIFYYRIYDGTIHGSEICMLLFDQNIFKMNESEYNVLLEYNNIKTYNFILKKIKNLEITPAQLALDPCSGSVVVNDPNNGDVLALVTYPSYDNNKLSGSVDPKYWSKLINDESDPLYNRATMGLTAPGSTFKMITAMAALEEGILSNPNQEIATKGIFEEITPSPKCWIYSSGHATHGSINVKEALAFSCNYFFYEMGYKLGTDSNGDYNSDIGLSKIKKYADVLGITEKSGVEISETEPSFSTISSVHSAIGQGSNSYAPVQISRYISTIANGGKNYKLTLINNITDSKGENKKDNKPELENTVECKESTLNAIHEGMRAVVTKGTVKNIFTDIKVDVAGKSGTAEENSKRNAHALFVAYAPYKDPEISVVSVIPFANKSGNAAELTRDVIKYYFGELNSNDIATKDVEASNQDTHD